MLLKPRMIYKWVRGLEEAGRVLNGANATRIHTSRAAQSKRRRQTLEPFDIVRWIRAQWLGHILRMGDDTLVKKAVHALYDNGREGDLLMDAPVTDSWTEL